MTAGHQPTGGRRLFREKYGRISIPSAHAHLGVTAVERGRVESTLTNSKAGTVRARLRSRLTAETGGRVVEVPVEFRRREAGVAHFGRPRDILWTLSDMLRLRVRVWLHGWTA